MDLWSSLLELENQVNAAQDARAMKFIVIFGIFVIIAAVIEAVIKKS